MDTVCISFSSSKAARNFSACLRTFLFMSCSKQGFLVMDAFQLPNYSIRNSLPLELSCCSSEKEVWKGCLSNYPGGCSVDFINCSWTGKHQYRSIYSFRSAVIICERRCARIISYWHLWFRYQYMLTLCLDTKFKRKIAIQYKAY